MTLGDAAALTPALPKPSFPLKRLDELPPFEYPGQRIITLIMQKGGVGKTATTVGLGDDLAQQGIPVVILDVCHTGMATASLLGEPYLDLLDDARYGQWKTDLDANLANLMLGKWDGNIADLAIQRDENLWVVPCSAEMATLADDLAPAKFREERLLAAIGEELPQRAVVLIDCPPVVNVVTNNAIIAAARRKKATGTAQQLGGLILLPELSRASLKTQDMLFQQCDALVHGTQYENHFLGWFASETDQNRLKDRRAREILSKMNLRKLGEMPIRTDISNARDEGLTLREFMPQRPGSKERNQEALDIWRELGDAVREALHV
jgi:chromosome partitioning protein